MAYILLGILFALIAAVFALPHIPFVRRLAGVEEEEREFVRGPVITDNYRPWMLRPVARTADGFTSARRRFDPIEPVTVLDPEKQLVDFKRLAYPPRGIRVYGARGAIRTGRHSADREKSCRVNTGMLPERKAGFELGIALGDRQLLDSLGGLDNKEQQADTAAED
jgi:hypothetical protein